MSLGDMRRSVIYYVILFLEILKYFNSLRVNIYIKLEFPNLIKNQ
jgi:hypothetical protein